MSIKLLTPAIKHALPSLGTTDGIPLQNKIVVCKFFTPDANWTWFVFEGEPEGEDYLFFGLVEGIEAELGYFCLSELQSVKGIIGLPVERDQFVFQEPLSKLFDVINKRSIR